MYESNDQATIIVYFVNVKLDKNIIFHLEFYASISLW